MNGGRALAAAGLTLLLAGTASTAPNVELHSLKWFVHDSLGSLEENELIIEAAVDAAEVLLKGDQGPADVPCCTELAKASIQQFSDMAGRDLSVLNTSQDYEDLDSICAAAGGGMCAFLVQSITYCGGSAPGSVGCADWPSCASDPSTLVLAIGLDEDTSHYLGAILAHERGHNACLGHVFDNACRLMSPSSAGGCLSQVECQRYRDASTETLDATCGCHDDAFGSLSDQSRCDQVEGGVCSGGVCGESDSDASLALLAAGGPEAVEGDYPDDAVVISGASGGWHDLGAFDPVGTEVTGLAYAPGRSTLYGVTRDDRLVTVNPKTGAIANAVGFLPAGGLYNALAFNPGAERGLEDDVLYAIRTAEDCDTSRYCDDFLVEIDPDDASATTLFDISTSFKGGIQGLAYDVENGRLVGTAWEHSMLWGLDPNCRLSVCRKAVELAPDLQTRVVSSLSYSPVTGRFYAVGSQAGPRALFDSVDAATFEQYPTVGIDGFTPGGLAALPEPSAVPAQALALATLLWLARRRRSRRSHSIAVP